MNILWSLQQSHEVGSKSRVTAGDSEAQNRELTRCPEREAGSGTPAVWRTAVLTGWCAGGPGPGLGVLGPTWP